MKDLDVIGDDIAGIAGTVEGIIALRDTSPEEPCIEDTLRFIAKQLSAISLQLHDIAWEGGERK